MFGIGSTELALILLFAFMVFGPDKLPGMGRTVGRALRQFRSAQEGFTKVVQAEIVDPATEAMSDSPKRPNRNRAAEVDDDSDIDAETIAATRAARSETFAERKKRLAAERAAREATAGEAKGEQDASDGGGADSPAAEAAVEAPTPEATPAPTTAADLYAMRPARRTPEAGPAQDDQTTGEEGGDAEA